MTRITLAALAALTLGPTLAAAPARAQYYDDGPRRYDRGYEDRYDRYERRRRDDYYEDRYERRRDFGRRGGSICVTSRGNCPTRPAPFNAPCGCEIPGFGFKRGAIGG